MESLSSPHWTARWRASSGEWGRWQVPWGETIACSGLTSASTEQFATHGPAYRCSA
jgi:hypothetical protein